MCSNMYTVCYLIFNTCIYKGSSLPRQWSAQLSGLFAPLSHWFILGFYMINDRRAGCFATSFPATPYPLVN